MSFFYKSGMTAFAAGDVNWNPGGSSIRVQFVDLTLYTPDVELDANLEDIAPAARQGSPIDLVLLSSVGGLLDAEDTGRMVFASGLSFDALAVYLWTGDEATSTLLMLLNEGINLPYTTGNDYVRLLWPAGGLGQL